MRTAIGKCKLGSIAVWICSLFLERDDYMNVDIEVKMPDEFYDSLREVIARLDRLLEKYDGTQKDLQ